MSIHQVAFICSGVLLVSIAVMQVILRRQAHDAKYGIGGPGISPWDVRYVNDLGTIWKAHKEAYKASGLRSVLVVCAAAWLASILVAVLSFLVKS
jgi:hypothetical protein